MIASWLENYDKPRQYVEMQTHYSADERFVIVKAVVSLVVVHSCESWTLKKVKCQGIDAFELWCWRRLLKVS